MTSTLSPQQTGAGRAGGPLYRGATVAQFFEEALLARLQAIPKLTALVGTGMFKTGLPQTHDLGKSGPALSYSIPTKPYGHVLTGSDGTATARVQIDAWSYSESSVKHILEAIRNGIDGLPGVWGNGTCQIMSVVQQDDIDADEPPKAGSDQWLYHSLTEYSVKYRVAIPTLS